MKLIRISVVSLIVVLIAFLAGCSEQGSSSRVNMQPGMWEIASSVDAANMPVNIPPAVSKQCLSDVSFVPQSNASAGNCEISNLETSGDKVSYTLTCNSGGMKTVSLATMEYHGTSMTGTITTEMTGGPAAMSMTYQLKGKRIGDCP